MSIRLDELVSERYPPGSPYLPEPRFERDIRTEPLYVPPPYTSLLDDVVAQGEDLIERGIERHAAAFPARLRLGQHVDNNRGFGTRVSPLNYPEARGGSLVAVSI